MRTRLLNLFISGLICCMSVTARHAQALSAEEIVIEPDIVYGRKFGMALGMDRYTPPEAMGAAVLFVNSGGFESGKIREYEFDENGTPSFVLPERLLLIEEGFHYPPLEQFSFIDLLVRARHRRGARCRQGPARPGGLRLRRERTRLSRSDRESARPPDRRAAPR